MQIAQQEAYGIASGNPGHWRPSGMTLGQWMMSLGYPLLGDLSQDGYRSENWIIADTAEDAINAWLSDDLHTNTMLSTERSDIGAGVAANEDGIYVVIETAWQTPSGKMQFNAYPTLTALASSALNINSVEGAGDSSQYMLPVALNTPLPNGDVYHEVQYGQTLWSIAINYHTTIKQIQQLNNLPDTNIRQGQKLLVAKNVIQITPTQSDTETPPAHTQSILIRSTATISPTPTIQPLFTSSEGNGQENLLGFVAITFAGIILAGIFIIMAKRKPL
jgi:LysM repeat protein